ncbi:hypothetical protein [Lysinibacillus sp. TE18511]
MDGMAKVKVTEEVANGIELIKKSLMTVGTLASTLDGEWKLHGTVSVVMHELTKEEALSAIFYGYEIERSPEEQIKDMYESYGYSPSAVERKGGIIDTLNVLGIHIEGVTHK